MSGKDKKSKGSRSSQSASKPASKSSSIGSRSATTKTVHGDKSKIVDTKTDFDNFVKYVFNDSSRQVYFNNYINSLTDKNSHFLYKIKNDIESKSVSNPLLLLVNNFKSPYDKKDFNKFNNLIDPYTGKNDFTIFSDHTKLLKSILNSSEPDIISVLLLSLFILDSKSNPNYPLNFEVKPNILIALVKFGLSNSANNVSDLLVHTKPLYYNFLKKCNMSSIIGVLLYNIFGTNLSTKNIIKTISVLGVNINDPKFNETFDELSFDDINSFVESVDTYTINNIFTIKTQYELINILLDNSYSIGDIVKQTVILVLNYSKASSKELGETYLRIVTYMNFLYLNNKKITSIWSILVNAVSDDISKLISSDQNLIIKNKYGFDIKFVYELLHVLFKILINPPSSYVDDNIDSAIYFKSNLFGELNSNILYQISLNKTDLNAKLFFEELIEFINSDFNNKNNTLNFNDIFIISDGKRFIILQQAIIDSKIPIINNPQFRSIFTNVNQFTGEKKLPLLSDINNKLTSLISSSNKVDTYKKYTAIDTSKYITYTSGKDTKYMTLYEFLYNVISYDEYNDKPFLYYLCDSILSGKSSMENDTTKYIDLLKNLLKNMIKYGKIIGIKFLGKLREIKSKGRGKTFDQIDITFPLISNLYLINYGSVKYINYLLEIGFDILTTYKFPDTIVNSKDLFKANVDFLQKQINKQLGSSTTFTEDQMITTVQTKSSIYKYINILSCAYLINKESVDFIKTVVDYYKSKYNINAISVILYNIILSTKDSTSCKGIEDAINNINLYDETKQNNDLFTYFSGNDISSQRYIFLFEPLVKINFDRKNVKNLNLMSYLGNQKCKQTIITLICKSFSDAADCSDKIGVSGVDKAISNYIKTNYTKSITTYLNISINYDNYITSYKKSYNYDILFQNPLFFLTITSSAIIDTDNSIVSTKLSNVIVGLQSLGASYDEPLLTDCPKEFIDNVKSLLPKGETISGTNITVKQMIEIIYNNSKSLMGEKSPKRYEATRMPPRDKPVENPSIEDKRPIPESSQKLPDAITTDSLTGLRTKDLETMKLAQNKLKSEYINNNKALEIIDENIKKINNAIEKRRPPKPGDKK
jgi:hypothetical protein